MILFFYLIVQSTCDLINVQFNESHLWSSNEQNSTFQVYKISNITLPYIYVDITLLNPDDEFMLGYFNGANPPRYFEDYLSSNIDYASVYENKLTRFLKIEPNDSQVYVSIFGYELNNFQQIIIQNTIELKCDRDCNGQGICKEDGCKCNPSAVGISCHQEALQISKNSIEVDNQFQFFYIGAFDYLGETININFLTTLEQGVFIFLMKSKILYLQSEYELDQKFVQQSYVNFQNEVTYQAYIPQDVDSDEKIVFAVKLANPYYEPEGNSYFLNISINTISQEEFTISSTSGILIIIFSVLGAILIIIFPLCLYKIRQRRRILETMRQLQLQLRQVVEENKNLHLTEHANCFTELQKEIISNDESCSICLELLINGLELIQTKCRHNFHKECIKMWNEKHKDCPVCRAQLQTI